MLKNHQFSVAVLQLTPEMHIFLSDSEAFPPARGVSEASHFRLPGESPDSLGSDGWMDRNEDEDEDDEDEDDETQTSMNLYTCDCLNGT